MSEIDHNKQELFSLTTSNEYCWVFVDNWDIRYFRSEQEALDYATKRIPDYCDGEWSDAVENLVIAKVTHTCIRVNVIPRPDESELNSEGTDGSGQYWDEYQFICDYEMQHLN